MRYEVWDIFTERAFGGNPLAVVWPEGDADAELRQRIAREFNFSETTFVTKAEAGGDRRVRIHTPTREIPFAGHPTIGTAIALAADGLGPDLMLELGVGPLAARAEGGRAEFRTEVPLAVESEIPAEAISACLSLSAGVVSDPVPYAGVGLPFMLVPIPDAATLAGLSVDLDAMRRADAEFGTGVHFDVFAYVRDGSDVRARMFAPLDGIPEDPATGSASAALAAWIAREEGEVALSITQGVEMGRPSYIEARADASGVTIAGSAVKVMEGRLCL